MRNGRISSLAKEAAHIPMAVHDAIDIDRLFVEPVDDQVFVNFPDTIAIRQVGTLMPHAGHLGKPLNGIKNLGNDASRSVRAGGYGNMRPHMIQVVGRHTTND